MVIRTACSHWSMRTESIRAVWHRLRSSTPLAARHQAVCHKNGRNVAVHPTRRTKPVAIRGADLSCCRLTVWTRAELDLQRAIQDIQHIELVRRQLCRSDRDNVWQTERPYAAPLSPRALRRGVALSMMEASPGPNTPTGRRSAVPRESTALGIGLKTSCQSPERHLKGSTPSTPPAASIRCFTSSGSSVASHCSSRFRNGRVGRSVAPSPSTSTNSNKKKFFKLFNSAEAWSGRGVGVGSFSGSSRKQTGGKRKSFNF